MYVGALREKEMGGEKTRLKFILEYARRPDDDNGGNGVCSFIANGREKERRRYTQVEKGHHYTTTPIPTIAFFSRMRLLSDDGGKSQIFSLICSETPSLTPCQGGKGNVVARGKKGENAVYPCASVRPQCCPRVSSRESS